MSPDLDANKLNELCYIYSLRNALGKNRNSVRQKKKYILDLKKMIQLRNNPEATQLYSYLKNRGQTKSAIAIKVALAVDKNKLPKKYAKTTLSEINLMLLQGELAVTESKIAVALHTKKYTSRVRKLCKALGCNVDYDGAGLVAGLMFRCSPDSRQVTSRIDAKTIEIKATQHLLSLEIEKMLK